MANVYRLQELHVNNEAAFAENAETPASNTFDTYLPALSCTLTVDQERIRDMGYRSRMNEENLSNLGIRVAAIEFEQHLCGHFTTTAGALTPTQQWTLLKDGLGGGSSAMNGTTISAATTGASYTFTSSVGLAAGMLGRIGSKAEARGNGQLFVANSVAGPVTSLISLPGTPSNGDVVYAMLQAYHDESVASTLTTKRFEGCWSSSPTTGLQFQILGCQLAGVKMTFPQDGTMPRITFRYLGAYWQRYASTVPSALTMGNHYTGPVAAGSMFVQAVGTSTRNTETPASIELDLDLGLEPIIGPGGNGTYQTIVGWQRTGCKPTLTLQIPWEDSYETWFDTNNSSIVAKHIGFNTNASDGRCFAFYMPNAIPVGNKPSKPIEVNGQAYVPVTFLGRDGTTTTSELTRSAIRFGIG